MDTIKTIYNLQRFVILKTKLNPATSNLISDSYAYAWYTNTFPYLHNSDIHYDLKDCFSIKEEQVKLILETADKNWLNKKNLTFYEYEDFFHTNNKEYNIGRDELIRVFRYSYLEKSFDSNFWKKLLEEYNYPVEANTIKNAPNQLDLTLI